MFDKADNYFNYFPVFMMGNSIQSLLANRVSSERSMLRATGIYYNTPAKLRLTAKPEDTYIFDELDEDQADEYVQGCDFLIR